MLNKSLTIAAQLEELILGLQPGDQIPSRPQLMKLFGVAGDTIERSIYYLLGKGLVEIRIRRRLREGVFVAERKEGKYESISVG